ncbi:hypothetical protein FB45DRAFT_1034839 [Roridomyces roridus]|uniref:F-box domain-containing protein n=1 Tax=Roridomyces roridus TaxID=1738132 RepID=A0AAD7BC49_9AGAR|nr:hypothetical protein FB45DRAFT_1034839 [Roridomyces roridus]
MDSPVSSPSLPPELEREIFELAAYCRPVSVPTLMLVAWRVHGWVKHLLLRVVLLIGDSHSREGGLWGARSYPYPSHSPISTRIPIIKECVRHLFLSGVFNDTSRHHLSAATNVEDLWLSTDATTGLREIVGSLRLRRLACDLQQIFETHRYSIDFTLPVFSRLTHLELFDRNLPPDFICGLGRIPNLTHLAFGDPDLRSKVPVILDACKLLRVLIYLEDADADSDTAMGEFAQRPTETRFVWMSCVRYIKDWQMGALTGADYWARAEDFVRKRNLREVDDGIFWIEEDDSLELP